MAQTTIESGGGVGIHAFYHICQEGKLVATMTRHSSYRTPWTVYSFPYSRKLATLSKDINVARERVASLTYPTPAEQYEADCQDIARIRREKMEHAHGAHIVALSRAMLDGSNSARAELADLYEKFRPFARRDGLFAPAEMEQMENVPVQQELFPAFRKS